jgi:hypothetical protein
MSVQTLYVAHTAGTVLGSHTRSPWVAASAAQAAATVWDGQPVFTDRAEAFAWIETTRAEGARWLDFAVARLDADAYPDPPGPRRVRIDYRAVADPHRQVVRADTDSPGPRPDVLNALYHGVHERALHEWWLSGQSADRAAALAGAAWRATYPIGFHDAAQVVAGRIGHAAHLLLTDPDPRNDLDDSTAAGLAALTRTAAALAHTDLHVPDPPEFVVADTTAIVATDPDHGWRHAVDRLWAAALLTAADDATTSAATNLRQAWRSHGHADTDTLTRQAFGGWLDRALSDTQQVVVDEWRHVCGQRPLRPVPAAARAYPAVTSIRVSSTVDADLALTAAPMAGAALAPGRAR